MGQGSWLRYGLNDRRIPVRFPADVILLFYKTCPPRLLLSAYRGLFPREHISQGMKVTAHLHLVPRLGTSGVIFPLPSMSCWRAQGKFYPYKRHRQSVTGRIVSNIYRRMKHVHQWFTPLGRDPNEGRGGSDVVSQEGFMENSIIMKK
jgi:hypothetical protein